MVVDIIDSRPIGDSPIVDGRCRGSPTTLRHDAYALHVAQHGVTKDVLCKHVRRILATGHIGQREIAFSEAILYPQIGSVEMPNSAQASSSANADGRRRIGQDLEIEVNAKIASQRLEAKTDRRSAAYAAELSFSR